jgi:hypothetical protein
MRTSSPARAVPSREVRLPLVCLLAAGGCGRGGFGRAGRDRGRLACPATARGADGPAGRRRRDQAHRIPARSRAGRVVVAAPFASGLVGAAALRGDLRASALAREKRILVAAAAGRRASVEELRALTTPGLAFAMTLQVDDPAAFLKHRVRSFLDLLYPPRVPLLGFYVGLEDARGRLVWATSRLPNEGAVFAIPRLDSCSPVVHSQPALRKPPPCPVR